MTYQCGKEPAQVCKFCVYTTYYPGDLKKHMIKLHQYVMPRKTPKEQAFKCNVCGKTYKLKGTLTRHLKYECGKTPTYYCTICDYSTYYPVTLKAHIINKNHN